MQKIKAEDLLTNETDNYLILYHASCTDGFCAAYIARKYLSQVLTDKIFVSHTNFVPVAYKQKLPDATDKVVIMLDFSCKIPEMEQLLSQAKQVILIDHHKTAIDDFINYEHPKLSKLLDNNHSGAYLSWEFFFPNYIEIPWVVLYVEDRDLWKKYYLHIEEITCYLQMLPYDFNDLRWFNLFRPECRIPLHLINDRTVIVNEIEDVSFTKHIIGYGTAILTYKQNLVATILSHSYNVRYEGLVIPCANTGTLQSEVAGSLCKDRPFAFAWYKRADGQIQVSLRSDDKGFDVSEVAKKLGGGGHKHAAGCELDEYEFLRLFPSLFSLSKYSEEISILQSVW